MMMFLQSVLMVLVWAGLSLSGQALADQQVSPGQSLAATCANCHGTNGRAALAPDILPLAGRPAGWIQAQMADFKSGRRPATIMHQIARGYSERQIEQIALWLETR
jgi:sulfide dehydrogenase cytochrome subunit